MTASSGFVKRTPADYFFPRRRRPFRAQSRPPMEQRAVTDHVALFGKGHAAFANGLIEILNRVEAFVGERFLDELPAWGVPS